mmetsp:Transcript_22622/g.26224  ORF Transcript_22622/g.26224 Transcript_22622/m.26224 type:complete len:383 (-) Transcript_22622:18-1166(-)
MCVSDELSSMVKTERGTDPKASNTLSKVLLFSSVALTAVVVALSIAVAAESGRTTTTETIKEMTTSTSFEYRSPPVGDKLVNTCNGKKIPLPNIQCMVEAFDDSGEVSEIYNLAEAPLGTLEQSGVNVTKGYQGSYPTEQEPFLSYFMEGMCPVNVHWHLGTEHLSKGEYDDNGSGPSSNAGYRRTAENVRPGYQCHHYDKEKSIFNTEYDWQYCVNMHVGETYEVHWPHSSVGACGTLNQYQTPFYDGVFCNAIPENPTLGLKVGVQAQVFTIVNDERYFYPDMLSGMIVDGNELGTDVAKYTGSTTGTSRNDTICSTYSGITWHVDRKCHLISASSFDKLCADMLSQRDDMSKDLYPHGARDLVPDNLAANNQQRKFLRD